MRSFRGVLLAALVGLALAYLCLMWHWRGAIWECLGQSSYCVWTSRR